jgi:hypothetical protein
VTTPSTGWNADTVPGSTHSPGGGGLYRGSATVLGQAVEEPHESWLHNLGTAGRHAASD